VSHFARPGAGETGAFPCARFLRQPLVSMPKKAALSQGFWMTPVADQRHSTIVAQAYHRFAIAAGIEL
jgi:hypothetical protein